MIEPIEDADAEIGKLTRQLEGAEARARAAMHFQAECDRYRVALVRAKAALSIPSIVDAERIIDIALVNRVYDTEFDGEK